MKKGLSWIITILLIFSCIGINIFIPSDKVSAESQASVSVNKIDFKSYENKIEANSSNPYYEEKTNKTDSDTLLQRLRPTGRQDTLLGHIYETEPNDYLSSADTIYTDYAVHGYLGYAGDKFNDDFFKLTVSKSGTLLAVGIFDKLYYPYTPYLYMWLYDSNGNLLTSSYYDSTDDLKYFSYSVSAGTYYVRIFNGDSYNDTGSYLYYTPYSFTVGLLNNDATLTDIQVDGKSIPNFYKYTYSYNLPLPANPNNYTVTAYKSDVNATGEIKLPSSLPGTAYINITAADGVTKQTYTLNFQGSNVATLAGLQVNGNAVPGFNPDILNYNYDLPANTTSVQITATKGQAGQNLTINNPTTLNGTGTVVVTAEDKSTTKTYSIKFNLTTAPTVSASPKGGNYTGPQSVTLTASKTCTIYYTTNGSTPTTSSSVYGSPIAISTSTTLKFMGVDSSGNQSQVYTEQYTIAAITVAAPTANPAPGTVAPGTTVQLSSTTSGAAIYYTLDGSTPTSASSLYSSPITISKDTTIKAIAIKDGVSSTVSSFAYKVAGTPGVTAIIAKDNSTGILYLYDYTALRSDYLNYQMGKSALLFQHYVNKTVVAFKDGAKGYVDYNNIRSAYVNAQQQGQQFNLDTYIQNLSIPYSMPSSIKKVSLVNGAIVEENYTP